MMEEISKYVKEAFALLEKVNSSVAKEYDSLLEHELTSKQFLILRTVRDAVKITVNELSEKLEFSPSSVSQLINRLETGSYLRREMNPKSRREIFVMLGERGISLFQEYSNFDQSIIEKYYSGFSLEEVILFRNLVQKLYDAIHSNKT